MDDFVIGLCSHRWCIDTVNLFQQFVCGVADFLLCIQLEQQCALQRVCSTCSASFQGAFQHTSSSAARFFSRRVWLNQCHCCYHRCARGVPDPDALAPAASPHGRAGSYNLATPPEKDPLIAIRVSLNHRRCCVPQRTLQIGNPRDQRQRRQITKTNRPSR